MARTNQKMGIDEKIEVLKVIFEKEYNQEKLELIHTDLCKDVTFAFLFERKFNKKETGKSDIPFKLISDGEVFLLEESEYVRDFAQNYTSNLEWDEDKGNFETYGDLFFEHVLKEINDNILAEYNKQMGKNAFELLMVEANDNDENYLNSINELFTSLMNKIWTRFCTTLLADIIEKNKADVYKEEFDFAKIRDGELEKESTAAFLYQEIVEELMENYEINLIEYETITKKDKEVLEALNEWAKTTTFNRLEILDYCLPTDELDEYKWLDQDVYDEKVADFQKTVDRVEDFFAKSGIKVIDKSVSYHTNKLYGLLNAILDVPGEKIVSIYGSDTCKTYCFDDYNRILKINNFTSNDMVIETYDKFLNDLDYQLSAFGTVVVKNLIGKNAIKKDKQILEVLSYELRTAYLIKGIYTGLSKEDAAKFLYFVQDNNTKYEMVDWSIGNRNIIISTSTDFGEEDLDDEG